MRPIPAIAKVSLPHLDGGHRLGTDRRINADTTTAFQLIILCPARILLSGQITTAGRPYPAVRLAEADHAAAQIHIAGSAQDSD